MHISNLYCSYILLKYFKNITVLLQNTLNMRNLWILKIKFKIIFNYFTQILQIYYINSFRLVIGKRKSY